MKSLARLLSFLNVFILIMISAYSLNCTPKEKVKDKSVRIWIDSLKNALKYQTPLCIEPEIQLAEVELGKHSNCCNEYNWTKYLVKAMQINVIGEIARSNSDSVIISSANGKVKSFIEKVMSKYKIFNLNSAERHPKKVAIVISTNSNMKNIKVLFTELKSLGIDTVFIAAKLKNSRYPHILCKKVSDWHTDFKKSDFSGTDRINEFSKYTDKEFSKCPSVNKLLQSLEKVPYNNKQTVFLDGIYNALQDCDFENYESILSLFLLVFRSDDLVIWRGCLDKDTEPIIVSDSTKCQEFITNLFTMKKKKIWIEVLGNEE